MCRIKAQIARHIGNMAKICNAETVHFNRNMTAVIKSDLPQLYHQEIMRLAASGWGAGRIAKGYEARLFNPLCGDEILVI